MGGAGRKHLEIKQLVIGGGGNRTPVPKHFSLGPYVRSRLISQL